MHTEDQIPPKTITALLLVFRKHANTPVIIHHAMLLIKKQTEYLNPGQSPFMTPDQSLFALAKEIQWLKPDLFGEVKSLAMMGDLQIEMNLTECLVISEVYLVSLSYKGFSGMSKTNLIYSCKSSKLIV